MEIIDDGTTAMVDNLYKHWPIPTMEFYLILTFEPLFDHHIALPSDKYGPYEVASYTMVYSSLT